MSRKRMIAGVPSCAFGVIISLLAVLLTAVPCSVTGFAAADTIHGQILMEDGSPAAGIKVDVLSSVLDKVYDEDITGFANYYAFSVFTDIKGEYEFTRPSPYCMVEVDVDTLPLKTGIDTQSVFLYPEDTPEAFTIYNIDRVEYDSGSVSIYGNGGKNISASFTICDAKYTVERNTDTAANADDRFADRFCGIKNVDAVIMSRSVNANGFEAEFTEREDLSEYSLNDKADVLYSKGLISEAARIFAYLYALETRDLGEEECMTSFYEDIDWYFYDGQSVTNFALYIMDRYLSAVEASSGFDE